MLCRLDDGSPASCRPTRSATCVAIFANAFVLALEAGAPEAGDPESDWLLLRLGGASAIRARATTEWWASEGHGRWCGSALDLI